MGRWCGRQGPRFSDLIGQNVTILIFIPSSCPTLAGTEFAGLMPLTCVGFTTFMWPFRSSDLLPFNSLQLPSGLGTVLPLSEQASQSCPTHSWFSGFQRDGYKENHLGKFQAAVTKPISTEGRLITQLINPTDVTLNACFFVIPLHTSCWLNRLHGPRSECQHGLQELQVGPGVSLCSLGFRWGNRVLQSPAWTVLQTDGTRRQKPFNSYTWFKTPEIADASAKAVAYVPAVRREARQRRRGAETLSCCPGAWLGRGEGNLES